ncbi:P4HB, partial [Symbiodinium microadriaticum]
IEEEDDVLVLTSDNFQEALDQYDPLLVEFYAPVRCCPAFRLEKDLPASSRNVSGTRALAGGWRPPPARVLSLLHVLGESAGSNAAANASGCPSPPRLPRVPARAFPPLAVCPAPQWCGHCKRLAPEYAKAASELLSNDPPLRIAKVDATISNELATKFGVQGFPTMKFFRGGQPQEYGGGRTASEIVDWVKRKSGPAFKHVADAAEATEFKGSSSVTVFGFFAAAEGTNFEAFASAAAASDDVSFAVVTDADVRTALGVTGTDDTVVLFKDFDEGQADFEGDLTSASDISDFVGTHRLPLVTTFTSE